MGSMRNTQSAEAPRKHRKLSKPPVGSHASAASLPYAATAVTPPRQHSSNSYLVGSLPPVTNKVSSWRAPPKSGITVPVRDHMSPLPSPTCRNAHWESTQLNGAVRSQSIQSEQSLRIPRFANRSRASSIVQDGDDHSLTCAERFVQWPSIMIYRANHLEQLANSRPPKLCHLGDESF